MNISTYESRIKALEDQLNPPGPGGSTGLLSVTVSPDITLEGGTSLNAKLAAEMPVLPGEYKTPAALRADNIAEEYSVTCVPGSAWRVAYPDGQGNIGRGDIGAPVTYNVTRNNSDNQLIISAVAIPPDTPEGQMPPEGQLSSFSVTVGTGTPK